VPPNIALEPSALLKDERRCARVRPSALSWLDGALYTFRNGTSDSTTVVLA